MKSAPTLKFTKTTLLTAVVLSTLATGVFVGGAVAADTPQAHSDGVAATLSDTGITAKVKAKLMAEDALNKSDISVTTTNGVVTLKGSASNQSAKDMAGDLTKSIEGVKSIDNSLHVPGSSKTVTKTKRAVSDSWITTKVKSELLADSLSKGFDVKVETMNGVVVLKGELTTADAIEHVKNIAAKVEGVKSVNTEGLSVAKK